MSSNESSRDSDPCRRRDVGGQQCLGRRAVQVHRVGRDSAAADHDHEAGHRLVERAQRRLGGAAAERVVGAGDEHRDVVVAQRGQRGRHCAARARADDRERPRLPAALGRPRGKVAHDSTLPPCSRSMPSSLPRAIRLRRSSIWRSSTALHEASDQRLAGAFGRARRSTSSASSVRDHPQWAGSGARRAGGSEGGRRSPRTRELDLGHGVAASEQLALCAGDPAATASTEPPESIRATSRRAPRRRGARDLGQAGA